MPTSRHPFQIWALLACLLSGSSIIFGFGDPKSLNELMPTFMVLIWGVVLMVGGALGLVAAWLWDRIYGLLVERLALGAIGGMALIYGATIFFVARSQGTVAGILVLSISGASLWRIRQANRELRVLQDWHARRQGGE